MPEGAAPAAVRAAAPALSVGLLAGARLDLGRELRRVEAGGAAMVHFDIMDGHFCPELMGDLATVAAVRTPLLKDVHLMVDDPLGRLEACVAAGADAVTLHLESTRHPHRALQALGELTNANDPARGILRGLALNPGTPLAAVESLLDGVDLLLVLAINPGWPGQRFLPSTLVRLRAAREMVARSGRQVLVGVDGSVTLDLLDPLVEGGADVIVAGSAILGSADPAAALERAAAALSRPRAA